MQGERGLIYFPILHTAADLGELGGAVERLRRNRAGRQVARQSAGAIERLWGGIERAVGGLKLDYRRVRIYQDGLPQCGHELEIVRELAASGSCNHRLVLELHGQGATIMGTEPAALLIEEYQQASGALESGGNAAGRDELLERRDRAIAARINGTLEPGETGVLFLGLLHDVARFLDADIRVRFPVGGLSGPQGADRR